MNNLATIIRTARLGCIMAIWTALGQPVLTRVINFDNLGPGLTLSNQYEDLGVVFFSGKAFPESGVYSTPTIRQPFAPRRRRPGSPPLSHSPRLIADISTFTAPC